MNKDVKRGTSWWSQLTETLWLELSFVTALFYRSRRQGSLSDSFKPLDMETQVLIVSLCVCVCACVINSLINTHQSSPLTWFVCWYLQHGFDGMSINVYTFMIYWNITVHCMLEGFAGCLATLTPTQVAALLEAVYEECYRRKKTFPRRTTYRYWCWRLLPYTFSTHLMENITTWTMRIFFYLFIFLN